jgi:hypothetical protein
MHRSNTHTRKVALQTLALGVPLGKIAVDGAGRWCPVGGGAKAKGDGRLWWSCCRMPYGHGSHSRNVSSTRMHIEQ